MAKKDRNNITKAVEQNIYDNSNKEIMASMIRDVFNDYRDSFFNLIDDRLKDVKYDGNATLENIINASANVPPLWGSTDYFDPGSTNGHIITYSQKGIVSSMLYKKLTSHDCEVTINFKNPIGNRKISISIWRPNTNADKHNDILAPSITRVSASQIKVALREVANHIQTIRLEILAFVVAT